jgi:hypothetical protein
MSTVPHHGKAARLRGRKPWCPECATDEHLVVESIQVLQPPRTGLVDAAYTCVRCGYFYAHAAAVARVAEIVNRPLQGTGLLQFGGVYLHCGEPMTPAGAEHRSIYAPASSEPFGDITLGVYLRTRVLRCGCGFLMEIPD